MLSKNRQKFILSLQKKKLREKHRMFVVEGDKMVKEFISSGFEVVSLVAKPEYISGLGKNLSDRIGEIVPVSFDELRKISTMKTPHNALAVVKMPERVFDAGRVLEEICVALDFIQDPGNLGTIIRSAAWFGFRNIICSSNCVDVYNPKVIQATMGAIMVVNVYYTDLTEFLGRASGMQLPVYGTLLNGEPIYNAGLENRGVILLGNESRGISGELLPFVTHRIMIPKMTDASAGIDSLNAAMAASVVFSEFARRREY